MLLLIFNGLLFALSCSDDEVKFTGIIKNNVYVKGSDEMAAMGEIIFSKKCLSCHSLDVNFKGPELGDVVKRRKAEWILNMIINPEEMISKDADAKYLFLTHAVKMVLKNVSEDDAKAVLEYLKFVNNSKKII
jgi:cytochrome c551/c552